MIQLQNVTKIYRTDTVETTALNNINLNIEKGSFVAVKGPSGSGKSTLLNIIGLLDRPTSGKIIFQDKETSELTEKERDLLRRSTIGFVFQKFNLIDSLTIYENIELPLRYLKYPIQQRKIVALETLKRLDLLPRISHYPYQLSGGQQQRVAVARCIITNPDLILADEPTGNLDSQNGHQVMSILQELNKEGKTILLVTHDDNYAAYASTLLNLLDGNLIT